jgi:NAD(P)-dependent dehydrogenase (short-subunit alcohol dehydrogenase family)
VTQRALVTGSNRGIGLALCRELVRRGAEVIAVCRTPSAELAALGVSIEAGIDVTDRSALEALASRLAPRRIDSLINNAGVLSDDELDTFDPADIERQFRVNALGPLLVTRALLPLLGPGAKVALVTSRMGSIADNTSGGYYGYRMSKAALNAAGVSLARDLASRHIAVIILHPGYVRTDMTGGAGGVDAADAAAGLLARIDELTLAESGVFRHMNGQTLPW